MQWLRNLFYICLICRGGPRHNKACREKIGPNFHECSPKGKGPNSAAPRHAFVKNAGPPPPEQKSFFRRTLGLWERGRRRWGRRSREAAAEGTRRPFSGGCRRSRPMSSARSAPLSASASAAALAPESDSSAVTLPPFPYLLVKLYPPVVVLIFQEPYASLSAPYEMIDSADCGRWSN